MRPRARERRQRIEKLRLRLKKGRERNVNGHSNRMESDTSGQDNREVLLDRIERMTELPLLVLAFAMVPLLAAPLFWDLSPVSKAVTFALDTLIWALFATDMAVKLAVAPRRVEYVRRHWLEVLVVLFPVARPLRILRLIVFGSRSYRGVVRLAYVDSLVVYAIGLVLIVATLVMSAERGHNPDLDSFPDALWWSIGTVTTVGYGDVVPRDPGGSGLRLCADDRRDRALRRSHGQPCVHPGQEEGHRPGGRRRPGRGGQGHARGAGGTEGAAPAGVAS